tara:strand:- start:2544 stop:2912 length:369 start_codon:yes stop_codon:yes gene_type:complete
VDWEEVVPSTSEKQHKFMAAIAHSPSFAKKVGVPMSVGKDFTAADKGRKFSKGGEMASKMNPGFMAMMSKKKGDAPDALAKHAAKPASKAHKGLKSGGAVDGVASKGKTKGTMIKMKNGGMC